MPKFRAKRWEGVLRLVEMGELDVFDALERAPQLWVEMRSEEETERYEQRRREWLERYEVDLTRMDDD